MYERWAMTEDEAIRITSTADITEADLVDAEAELADELGWQPDPASYPDRADGVDIRARGFGRAVAWQAAWRKANAAVAGDVDAGKTSESWSDYSYSKATPSGGGMPVLAPGLRVADRARSLLVKHGFVAHAATGRTTHNRGEPDLWRTI